MSPKQQTIAYFDEHINPKLLDQFRSINFRCLLISRTKKYVGRNEKDYISEISAENALFITSDREFANYILSNSVKHSGIVFLYGDWELGVQIYAAGIMAGFINGQIKYSGKSSIKNKVYYVGDDGWHEIVNKKDKLIFSIDGFQQKYEEYSRMRPGF